MVNLDAAILAVAHKAYVGNASAIFERIRDHGVLIDVKSALPAHIKPPRGIQLWSL
jgi:hypothetical protein